MTKNEILNLPVLQGFWEANLEFQKAVVANFKDLSQEEKIKLTKEYLLHIVSEMDEFLEATGKWKTTMQDAKAPSIPSLREEIIDDFKFLINIALIWDIKPADFIREFWRKTDVNWQKFKQSTLPISGHEKIAVFDLDGVLAMYPEFWLQFLNRSIRKKGEWAMVHIDAVNDIHNIAPHVDRKWYNEIKTKYREAGMNLGTPKINNADSVTRRLSITGYKIVILTRRPVHKHKRIYADTIQWLKNNYIAFDGIYWSEDGEKDNFLRETLPNIEFIVEDDPDQILRLTQAGFKVFYLERPYNGNLPLDCKAIKLEKLEDLLTFVSKKGGE